MLLLICRDSLSEVFYKKDALKNLISIIKKETLAPLFPSGFCEIFYNTFFTEYNRVTGSRYELVIKSTYCINNVHIPLFPIIHKLPPVSSKNFKKLLVP